MGGAESSKGAKGMIVLGVDPGSLCTGYGVVRTSRGRLEAVGYGTIRCKAKLVLHERLLTIHDGLAGVLHEHRPQAVSVESLFYAANVKSALTLGHARGVALLAVTKAGVPVFEYSPLEVKLAVTGYGRAGKAQLNSMVRALLHLDPSPLPSDAADALAIAICHAHSHWAKTGAGQGMIGAGDR